MEWTHNTITDTESHAPDRTTLYKCINIVTVFGYWSVVYVDIIGKKRENWYQ